MSRYSDFMDSPALLYHLNDDFGVKMEIISIKFERNSVEDCAIVSPVSRMELAKGSS